MSSSAGVSKLRLPPNAPGGTTRSQPPPSGNPAIAADNLCARIQADAEAQAQLILGEANAQAAQIVGVAEAEAQSLRNAVMIAAQAEAQAEEKRILAAVNLETRKIILTAREELVAQVIAQLQDRVSAWRATSGYRQYLKSLVIQAGSLWQQH